MFTYRWLQSQKRIGHMDACGGGVKHHVRIIRWASKLLIVSLSIFALPCSPPSPFDLCVCRVVKKNNKERKTKTKTRNTCMFLMLVPPTSIFRGFSELTFCSCFPLRPRTRRINKSWKTTELQKKRYKGDKARPISPTSTFNY